MPYLAISCGVKKYMSPDGVLNMMPSTSADTPYFGRVATMSDTPNCACSPVSSGAEIWCTPSRPTARR